METHTNAVLLKNRSFRDLLCELAKNPTELNPKAFVQSAVHSPCMFRPDKIAEQLVPNDARELCPVSVVGDGNCLLLIQEQMKEV